MTTFMVKHKIGLAIKEGPLIWQPYIQLIIRQSVPQAPQTAALSIHFQDVYRSHSECVNSEIDRIKIRMSQLSLPMNLEGCPDKRALLLQEDFG
jgi:hypothetical protein